jgi:hypothetical protein
MTDYNQIFDTQIEPDAPLTAVLASQWRDNPIAISEGADGAPRNRPLSLDLMIGGASVELSGTTPAEFLNLDGQSSLLIIWNFSGLDGGNILQIGYSTDNGDNWSSYQTIASFSDSGNLQGMSHVSLTEGRLNMLAPITGASGANAIRIRGAATSGAGRVAVIGLGRT